MSRIPDPDITPEGPFYQGRPLDRPDEEVVDQGAPFDIRTVMSRRGVLGFAGLGIGAMILAACTAAPSASSASPSPSDGGGTDDTGAETDSEIPEETAGPYPADGTNGPDILERSGIVRRDITRSIDGCATATGVPLTIEFQLVDVANGGAPFAGAALYAWHCTAEGDYSMYSDGLEDVTYLRGVQVADAQGRVSFTSIFPGCYAGRWPHIHLAAGDGQRRRRRRIHRNPRRSYRHAHGCRIGIRSRGRPRRATWMNAINDEAPGVNRGLRLVVRDTGIEPVTSSVSGKRATAAPIAPRRLFICR